MKSTVIRADELVIGDRVLLKNNCTKFYQVVDLYTDDDYIYITVDTQPEPTTMQAAPTDGITIMDDAA